MKKNSQLHPISRFRFGSPIVVLLILVIAFGGDFSPAQGQTGDLWSDPENLSNSGAASDPVIVVDADEVFHAVWLDEFEGLVHSSGDGIEWSTPVPLIMPARDTVPYLIADLNGNIHAFWTDIDGSLFYSRARASTLPRSSSWQSRALISNSALDFDVALDEFGDLHLTYVNPIDTEATPAGIYYRRLRGGTSTWLTPTLLFASPYFRSLDLPDSNVDVTTSTVGEEKRIFVAWDNRPRERIYLATSDDDGITWSEEVEIDQPQPGIVGSGPSYVQVEAIGDQVMLLWRVGEADSFCNQYYQFSQDNGESWSLRQPIYGSTPICLEEVQVAPGEEHTIVMGKADQVYFMAWDGSRWSDPQLEEPLSAFIDDETQNPVVLGCLGLIQHQSAAINAIGCDLGAGQDIWSMRRQLLDVNEWFPIDTGWGPLEDVVSDEFKLISPKIVTDNQNRTHIFWSKSDSLSPESLGKTIYYAVRQDGQWSPSAEILVSSSGKAEQIDAGIDSDNQISIVWSGGHGGEIFFSQADYDQAFIPTSWTEPEILPSPLPVGSSPDIFIDSSDDIYVSYAIPLNEQRGIYLTKSEDNGLTWMEAALVFDAQSAGWGMVDDPHLAITENGDQHIVWTRYSLPTGEGPLGLFYANSSDGGLTWSDAAPVVEDPVVWSDIAATGADTVQRVWQQKGSSGSTLWHEQSTDGGLTWERIAPVSVFGEIVANPSLSSDHAGRLHLLLVIRSGIDTYGLQHWVFDGQSWRTETRYDLQFSPVTEILTLGSDFSDTGKLDVVLLNSDLSIDGSQIYQMIFTNLSIDVPEIESTPVSLPTATQVVQETVVPTIAATVSAPTSEATPTTQNRFTGDQGNSGAPTWIRIIAPVVIGLILMVVIVFIVRRFRN
jgi:hypothetical protein